MRALVLFDLDGTLFLEEDPLAQQAMVDALGWLTETDVDGSAFETLDHQARTARWMAREVIRRHNLPNVDLAEWSSLVEALYLERLRDESAWEPPPRTRETLETLSDTGLDLALLTGVPKRIALERVRRLGLAELFDRRSGAYGSEVDERADLFRLALERADVPAAQTVHVGDTSRDVTCCNALGIRVVATAFDGGYASAADEADEAVAAVPDLVEAIRRSLSSRDSAADRR